MRSHVLGLFLGIIVLYYSISNTGDGRSTYFDFMSIVIVLGGSLSVAIMTNGFMKTIKLCGLFFKVFKSEKYDHLVVTKQLVEIARKKYYGDIDYNSLASENHHPFIKDGLRLLHNKFDAEKIKNIMTNMMLQRQENHLKTIENLEMIAKYPPAFGMMGTIIGLVAVLKQISTPDNMAAIGPAMAVALITTLYGIFLSNYVLQPIADNLAIRSQNDIKLRQLILGGTILIGDGNDPIYIRECLLSNLSPNDRELFGSSNSPNNVLKMDEAG
jgi:chemotaxis protein MotA